VNIIRHEIHVPPQQNVIAAKSQDRPSPARERNVSSPGQLKRRNDLHEHHEQEQVSCSRRSYKDYPVSKVAICASTERSEAMQGPKRASWATVSGRFRSLHVLVHGLSPSSVSLSRSVCLLSQPCRRINGHGDWVSIRVYKSCNPGLMPVPCLLDACLSFVPISAKA
jgi:hypothetical protein